MPITLPEFTFIDDAARIAGRDNRPVLEIVGPWGAAKTLAAVQVAQRLERPMLFITPGRIESEAVHDDLTTFMGEERAFLFPAWEVLPEDSMDPADDVIAERLETLGNLAAALDRGEPVCAVAPLRALLQHVLRRKYLQKRSITLELGEEYNLDDLLEQLVKMGYEREVMVEQRGQMSLRGGIFDVFPISAELPYRIEFFGDEVDSVRRFEPETQRSVDREETVQILPRSEKRMLKEVLEKEDALGVITDYFPKNLLVAIDEPAAVTEMADKLAGQVGESTHFVRWEDMAAKLARYSRIHLAQVAHAKTRGAERIVASMHAVGTFTGKAEGFWDQLTKWDAGGYRVRLLCDNTGERRRLLELLEEKGYRPGQDRFDLEVDIGRLRAGFVAPGDKLAVLSEREIFGRHYVRRKRRRFEAGATITQFSDLKAGDYIVHEFHGIGRYQGLRRFAGKAGDFLSIQYQRGDTIYVPATHIDQVQKYVGGDGATPKVDKVGGATWARTRKKVQKAVRELTDDLVKLYAQREHGRGIAAGPDTPWQREFEEAFPYDETPDQIRAIEDVKRDMEKSLCMDRLICGDVGYGKTEVALRAAFKCVMEGRQAALLAPTTVLVHQHYTTFAERLADFPVEVDMLSRFRTQAQQRHTIARLKEGAVNIIIGTHRLISKDIRFKDLGLIIIDEEQRFGVAHKEKLKQARTHVDVLTLSATPIPRTLNFSLMGIRDMSLINTAPNDRLPIHTCVDAWDEALVQEALVRELQREGQVYYLHNRVQTIEKVAHRIRELVPQARVAIGHGQMHRHELEDVMAAFIRHEVDVLVCTTIIASGIDIPNANTIIIDRADTFGLADLYQIRGRVGRYKHRAFAYLLVPGDRAISEEAQKRLKALEEFSALGSGYRIALRDLEIRGCGDLLGAEQSGNIISVGYETYKDLLAEAVAEIKGEPIRRRPLPGFEIAADAYIPDDYVPTPVQKINLYRRVAGVQSVEELDEIAAELADRFGRLPGPVKRLLEIMRTRAMASELGVMNMSGATRAVSVEFEDNRYLEPRPMAALREVFHDHVTSSWKRDKHPEISITIGEHEDPVQEAQRLLKVLADL
ncbi:MAG: transcription-repair coupling factor [Candidatus Hydrogenedentota bacterium]